MTTVHVLTPPGVDDPRRPSGGNRYDRRVCEGLEALGWRVHEQAVAGTMASALSRIADGEVVLVDGLVGCATPDALVAEADRLRLVVLLHMPFDGGAAELLRRAVVVTTSSWTRGHLLARDGLDPGRVHVAEPGVDAAPAAPGTPDGGRLLCAGAITTAKGHDVLLAALARVADLPWSLRAVGALDLEPGLVEGLRAQATGDGIGDRVRFTGPLTEPDLDDEYAASDLLVSASRAESYGMVVSEALSHGIPVVATEVGGVPEALGGTDASTRPGALVPADDPDALAEVLRRWLTEPGTRDRWRSAARRRAGSLPRWSSTAARVAEALAQARSGSG
ncbi:glycosyltransferase family 4 protein [Nocardioides sp. LS1]|uniref:glycosyltransferase family 4 protein n=1 Tax=Nocardioides sp. LS1 TaxID=1027620 RepID=UPI000F625340|nr:glycosyltransferase family 4 protein [Nocardioides sp. LS1]GCD92225.1 glycosyl transferase [Nocardioides sp. LS1]